MRYLNHFIYSEIFYWIAKSKPHKNYENHHEEKYQLVLDIPYLTKNDLVQISYGIIHDIFDGNTEEKRYEQQTVLNLMLDINDKLWGMQQICQSRFWIFRT